MACVTVKCGPHCFIIVDVFFYIFFLFSPLLDDVKMYLSLRFQFTNSKIFELNVHMRGVNVPKICSFVRFAAIFFHVPFLFLASGLFDIK